MNIIENNNLASNVFGEALDNLFNSRKSKVSRKDWAILLGVTESAISQWIKGKTFPDPDKLRTIIAMYERFDLDTVEKERFNYFMSVLEFPIKQIWHKAPSKIVGQNVSDYALQEFEDDLKNSMSILFYNLKDELYNQFLRQIELFKNDLVNKLLTQATETENETYHNKIIKSKQLQGSFCKKTNMTTLLNYVKNVKTIHNSYNEGLKKILHEIDFTKMQDESHCYKFNSFQREHENIDVLGKYVVNANSSDILSRKFIPNYNNFIHYLPDVNTERSTDNYLDNSIHSNQLTELFEIKRKSNDFYEIIFFYPYNVKGELLNIKVTEFLPRQFNKSHLNNHCVFFAFNYESDYKKSKKLKNAAVLTEKNCVNKMKYFNNDVNEKVHALIIDQQSLLNTRKRSSTADIASYLESVFKISENSSKPVIKNKKYLINPEHTDKCYSVEVLNIESKNKLITSAEGGRTVILITGNIEIYSRNENNDKVKIFNLVPDEYNNLPCIFPLEHDISYKIKSNTENSVALLIQEYV